LRTLSKNPHRSRTKGAECGFNDSELSLAHAVATFQGGRRFEEGGDATPANTGCRMALTRAKARVLCDAPGVALVAVAELTEE
jgi:hypothetical protein